MRNAACAVTLALALLSSGCAAKTGAGTPADSPGDALQMVGLVLTNSSGYTADVFAWGSLVATLPPSASTRIDVAPGTQRPVVSGVAVPQGDSPSVSQRPRRVRISVRPIYQRVQVEQERSSI
jgi:hypothetical protein